MSSLRSIAWPRLVLVAGLLLALAGTTGALAQGASPAPSDAVPVLASPGPDGAIPVVPDPTVIGDGEPTPWDHVVVGADGVTLTVYYWSGVQGCYGLKGVDVSVTDGVPTITVVTGRLQSAMGKMCIEQAFLYSTQVVLDRPLIRGGTAAG